MRETIFLEHRFAEPGEDGAIDGVAVRFDTLDSYGTTFGASAFGNLAGRQIPMLWSHNAADVVGSWTGFEATATELRASGKLNLEVQRAREVRAMLLAGDVRGVSIGFETMKDERRAGGVRHITQAKLVEISLVALPSVPGARVTSIRGRPLSAVAAFVAAVNAANSALAKGKVNHEARQQH